MIDTELTRKNASSYRSSKTEIRNSKTEGRGLFAKEPIRKGEIVSVRGGHILPRKMETEIKKPDGYWGYPIADEFVLAPLNTQEVEDVMMFLNHSCDPNVGIRGQILFVAMRDIDGDGNLDIFIGEMGSPGAGDQAKTYIWYGNGKGQLRKTVAWQGQGIHEGILSDLNGDGRLDILLKPYNHNAPRIDILLNQPESGR